jgi:hypothetical protein
MEKEIDRDRVLLVLPRSTKDYLSMIQILFTKNCLSRFPIQLHLHLSPSLLILFLEIQYKRRYSTSTHPYEHTHAHPTPMTTSEKLSRLDLEIHEVGHQERLAVEGDVASH